MNIRKKLESLIGRKLVPRLVKTIESIDSGKDIFVVAASDFEKSDIVFCTALLNEEKPILVIEPTASLIDEQLWVLSFWHKSIKAASLTEYNRNDHETLLKKFEKNKFSILYITPDLLKEKYFIKAIEAIEPWLVVVKECHMVQDWGGMFHSPYLEIKKLVNRLSDRPLMLAMTATAPPADRETIWDKLGMRAPKEIILSIDKPTFSVIVEDSSDYVFKSKKARIAHLCNQVCENIEKYSDGHVIVYALTPHYVKIIADYLEKKYPLVVTMSHSKMPKEKRAENEWLFLMNKFDILVTTCDFEQGFRPGVDKTGVYLVVHFGLPLSVADYYQQIGRVWNCGIRTHAVVIYDKELMKQNMDLISSAPKDVQKRLKEQQKELESILTEDKHIEKSLLKVLGERK